MIYIFWIYTLVFVLGALIRSYAIDSEKSHIPKSFVKWIGICEYVLIGIVAGSVVGLMDFDTWLTICFASILPSFGWRWLLYDATMNFVRGKAWNYRGETDDSLLDQLLVWWELPKHHFERNWHIVIPGLPGWVLKLSALLIFIAISNLIFL